MTTKYTGICGFTGCKEVAVHEVKLVGECFCPKTISDSFWACDEHPRKAKNPTVCPECGNVGFNYIVPKDLNQASEVLEE